MEATSETAPLVVDRAPAAAYGDPPKAMTFPRRMALYLAQFGWYMPKDIKTNASLEDAWAYFEHITLPRYFHDTDTSDRDGFPRAEPGETEKETKLYPVLKTPETDLADFGVGVGVYFLTLRVLAIIMFIAGLFSIPNIIFFWSDAYNAEHEFSNYEVLRTSAVCSAHSWEACPTCTKAELDYFPATFERYAEFETPDGEKLTFMEINNCQVNEGVGICAFATMIFVCIAMFVLAKYTRAKEAEFDAAQQTTTDYSVEVSNPPGDAKDIEEWRTFFEKFGRVTSVTVALDNEELLKKLMQRRSLVLALEQLQPPGTEETFDRNNLQKAYDEALPVAWYMKLMGSSDGPAIKKQIEAIDELVQTDLSLRDYQVSNVFVIFEEESSQQKALEAIQVSGWDMIRKDNSSLPSEYVFREGCVLHVVEPPEPSSVRWQDLDETVTTQTLQRLVTLFFTIICIIIGCAIVIFFRYRYGVIIAAFAVSGVNSCAPYVCMFLVSFESHASEGSRQASLYYKITAFLWITTAMLTSIITPFVETLKTESDSLVPAMYSIFITEMFVGPATQLLDIYGNFQKHILAPRAKSQSLMSSYFQGTIYNLSERYTNITNILFLTFYYAILFPAGFFFASATLGIVYWTDKYCILRVWKPAPAIGNHVANMSRIYFFSTALIFYAVMSSYGFASFPFDNACGGTDPIPDAYIGSFAAERGSGGTADIELTADHKVYRHCNQDMLQYEPTAFPPLPSKQIDPWMTRGQEKFMWIYAYTVLVIAATVIGIILKRSFEIVRSMFVSPFKGHIKTCESKKFDADMGAYLPQGKLPNDLFPVLFCDVSNIDEELIPWVDPENSYDHHNAIYDIEGLAEKPVFSIIGHYPAEK